MPFKSTKQAGWMFENKPAMAKKWASEMPEEMSETEMLPKKKKKKKFGDFLSPR